MRGKSFSDEGIIISSKSLGERDKLLLLFTKLQGKKYIVAKGARLPKSRKRGHLQIFSKVGFSATESSSHIPIFSDVMSEESFPLIRIDLKKISLAYFFAETIAKLTQEGQENVEIFNLLDEYFSSLEKTNKLKELKNKYIKDLLVVLGFWPKGRDILSPELVLESVAERKFTSVRVGKRVLTG